MACATVRPGLAIRAWRASSVCIRRLAWRTSRVIPPCIAFLSQAHQPDVWLTLLSETLYAISELFKRATNVHRHLVNRKRSRQNTADQPTIRACPCDRLANLPKHISHKLLLPFDSHPIAMLLASKIGNTAMNVATAEPIEFTRVTRLRRCRDWRCRHHHSPENGGTWQTIQTIRLLARLGWFVVQPSSSIGIGPA